MGHEVRTSNLSIHLADKRGKNCLDVIYGCPPRQIIKRHLKAAIFQGPVQLLEANARCPDTDAILGIALTALAI